MSAPLHVAILWHMHQPDYRDPVSGTVLMPWTWLHAVKDYSEMLLTLAEVPGARASFNFVPTLLEQLEGYARGEGEDYWLGLIRSRPEDLETAERRFILQHFFSVFAGNHINPYPRYAALNRKRRQDGSNHADFSTEELRDIQVFFLLAWSGEILRRDPLMVDLLRQGGTFSEEQKNALIALYSRTVASVIPLIRKMENEGAIEVSYTPYAHPILPLLCNMDAGSAADPGRRLPKGPRSALADAKLQVQLGRYTVERILGERPRGVWPAEGSVSEEAVALLAGEGALWGATDEAILGRSLPGGLAERGLLYRVYRHQNLPLFFRDRELSDRIGFRYAAWQSDDAVDDLIGELVQIAAEAPGGVVPIILDGENCWERYANNGYPFLTTLYQAVLEDPRLKLCTLGEAAAALPKQPLPRLASGSWINGNFNIWVGGEEENRAWELLDRVRSEILAKENLDAYIDEPEALAASPLMHLMRAEGSDWFWWYGDDHSTDQAEQFDFLFRRHLQAYYHDRRLPLPEELLATVRRGTHADGGVAPRRSFSPSLTDRDAFFGWRGAGRLDLGGGGAMHSGSIPFRDLLYGADATTLYLRLETAGNPAGLAARREEIEITLKGDGELCIHLDPVPVLATASGTGRVAGALRMEMLPCPVVAVPRELLPPPGREGYQFSLRLIAGGRELGRWPEGGGRITPFIQEEYYRWLL